MIRRKRRREERREKNEVTLAAVTLVLRELCDECWMVEGPKVRRQLKGNVSFN